MFSSGHLAWIGISVALIAGGYSACLVKKPPIEKMLKVCLGVGLVSEVVKILTVMNILPMVEPVIQSGEDGAQITYMATGEFSPYLEMAHLPIELCSLMIAFIAISLLMKNEERRSKLLSLMYVTGIIGGALGIFLAYITADYKTVPEYFASPRVWQYFLYHSMVVTLGLYLGFSGQHKASLRHWKYTIGALVVMDFPTFYLNSIFSQPVYTDGKPVGLIYRANFFSSYVNPLGLVLSQKWQWLLYLVIRLVIAVIVITFLLWLAGKAHRAPIRMGK